MSPQNASPDEAATLVACFTGLHLFYTVRFQMSPQIACLKGYKFTLVAFL